MTRIDNGMDWCELVRLAEDHGWRIIYRVARCQHGYTRQQTCVSCEGGYVDDTYTFANIGRVKELDGRALVAVSDDGEDVAYVPERAYFNAQQLAKHECEDK
jgi:hypothetical protein